MRRYLIGAIREAQERAKTLKVKIKSDKLPIHFIQLEQIVNNYIDKTISLLQDLLDLPDYQETLNQRERFDQFKKVINSIDLIENVAVAALSRPHPDDELLNRLMDQVRKEINYPISPPVVSSLSQDYYSIYPIFNLMRVPLLESDFLLHIPDMFHELAHSILAQENNPKAEPFRISLAKFNKLVRGQFDNEIREEKKKFGPKNLVDLLYNWRDSWIQGWSIELFCDLFGIFTIGPAFAWSHLHLSAKRNGDPFQIRWYSVSTHPPDHSRMIALLYAMDVLHFKSEKEMIEAKWNEYIELCGYKRTPEIDRALPDSLIQHAVTLAYEGTKAIGCRIPTTVTNDLVYSLLNNAWKRFWTDPCTYLQWEKDEIGRMKVCLSR